MNPPDERSTRFSLNVYAWLHSSFPARFKGNKTVKV